MFIMLINEKAGGVNEDLYCEVIVTSKFSYHVVPGNHGNGLITLSYLGITVILMLSKIH